MNKINLNFFYESNKDSRTANTDKNIIDQTNTLTMDALKDESPSTEDIFTEEDEEESEETYLKRIAAAKKEAKVNEENSTDFSDPEWKIGKDDTYDVTIKDKYFYLPKAVLAQYNVDEYVNTATGSLKDAKIAAPSERDQEDLFGKLPWGLETIDHFNVEDALDNLTKSHYGMDNVKEELKNYIYKTIYLAKQNQSTNKAPFKLNKKQKLYLKAFNKADYNINWNLYHGSEKDKSKNADATILCLVGEPGTGKSSIAKVVAQALGHKFESIQLGGIDDICTLKGFAPGWKGSCPGLLVRKYLHAKASNPVILLDEIDKVNSRNGNELEAWLSDILDPTLNYSYEDSFLQNPINLSDTLFICTANDESRIPNFLKDRMTYIHVKNYNARDKFLIARDYMLPEMMKKFNLSSDNFVMDQEAIKHLIDNYCFSSGARDIKKTLNAIICSKLALIMQNKNVYVGIKDVDQALKNYPNINDLLKPIKEVKKIGSVNALAIMSNSAIGIANPVESAIWDSPKEEFIQTGLMQQDVKEANTVALSYIKYLLKKYNINFDFASKTIHLNFGNFSSAKSGDSGTITATTSLLSSILRIPISSSVALTGTLNLHGDHVGKIGSVEEKIRGGIRQGIKTFFIPKENLEDLDNSMDEFKKAKVNIIPVEKYDQIFGILFRPYLNNAENEK